MVPAAIHPFEMLPEAKSLFWRFFFILPSHILHFPLEKKLMVILARCVKPGYLFFFLRKLVNIFFVYYLKYNKVEIAAI